MKLTEEKWEARRYKFMSGGPAQGFSANFKKHDKMRLFACCVVSQQEAGFNDTLDLRESQCPDCCSPGFNTGWGFWAFTCGAEILSDGEVNKECSRSALEQSKEK